MLNAKYLTTVACVCIIILSGIFSCARRGTVILESEDGRVIIESKGEQSYSEGKEPYYPSEVIKIPKGHMPPPGKCRIWYPDRPPGQQPPPGDCKDLKYQVPPGAWLIYG